MSEVKDDSIDTHFLNLIEEAEADSVNKRPKLSNSGDGRRQENQEAEEEGAYMSALRGSRSTIWQKQQTDLNLRKNESGTTNPSSTVAAGACFKCGVIGHWARDCGGGLGADRAEGFAPAKQCPCGSGTCLVLTSNTARNPGRMFYRCPLKSENGGCTFFEWCDSPSSGITIGSQSNSEVPVLTCPCGAGSCLILVSKSGKNEGQQYYKCPGNEEKGPCGFFKWCSEQQGSVLRQSSFSQQFHGSSSVSKSQPSTDKTNSSCFKCGQEGHWAKDCQNQPSNSFGGTSQPTFAGSGSTTGTCFKCGQEGHWAKECRNQPSNSSVAGEKSQASFAGLGSTTGTCFKCGKSGHWARDCPAQTSYSASAAAAPGKRNYGSSQSSQGYSCK